MDIEQRLAQLESRLQEIEDRRAIYECIRNNARGNDRFDSELVSSTYHTDGLHELGRHEIAGRDYGEHANDAHGRLFDVTLHNVTMHSCEIDGNVAHAESYNIGLFLDKGGETGRVLAGRYIDRLEKRDGKWRIMLRRATVEVALEGKATLPTGAMLAESGYLRGSRDKDDISYMRPLQASVGKRW